MTFEYLPLFVRNIRHHEARAAYWRAQGNEEYAKGSDRKAAKWRARQAALDEGIRETHAQITPILEAHLRSVRERIVADFEAFLTQGDRS